MDVRGKRILILGDSLSSGAATPGGQLGQRLQAAGAASVRVNGKVSRSAVNFFSGANGEDGMAVLMAEAAYRPQVVIVFLGTNDIGLPQGPDAAAFRRIAGAFPGAQLVAVGPPSFARADLTRGAPAVYATLQNVFGGVVDTRPMTADILTTAQGRTSDGVHFTAVGAAVFGQRLVQELLRSSGADASASSAMATPGWKLTVGLAALAALGVGVALIIRRRRWLGALTGAKPFDSSADFHERLQDADERRAFFEGAAKKVQEAADQIAKEGGGWMGSDKVYITDVAKRLGSSTARLAGLLLVARNKGWIDLSRADLVGAMDPTKVAASEIDYPGEGPSGSVHFILASRPPPRPREPRVQLPRGRVGSRA